MKDLAEDIYVEDEADVDMELLESDNDDHDNVIDEAPDEMSDYPCAVNIFSS